MNTKTVILSSTQYIKTFSLNSVTLVDMTTLSFCFSSINTDRVPIVVEFDWFGDSSVKDTYKASPTTGWAVSATTFIHLSAKTYSYTYLPESNTQTKSFSCIITCTNLIFNNQSTVESYDFVFVQPITIIAPSFYNKVNDMNILQTNIIDENNSVLITFGTSANGSVIETILPLD